MPSDKQTSEADDANRVLEEEAEGSRPPPRANQPPEEHGPRKLPEYFSDYATI